MTKYCQAAIRTMILGSLFAITSHLTAETPSARVQCEDQWQRAGHPGCISRLAVTSNSKRYAGYFVGGTTPFGKHGDGPSVAEGTWGWDYWGSLFKRHVALDWSHGRNSKRRFGQYVTDGPKLIEH